MLRISANNQRKSLIAEGTVGKTVRIFENHWYFDPSVVDMEHLIITERTYHCPYKGVCLWIDLISPDKTARNIGWVYHDPFPTYDFIRDQIAFYASDTDGTIAEQLSATA